MTANELADAMDIRASIRRQATSRKSVQEGANDRLADQLEQAATMLRQQTQEIEELKLRISQLLETQDYLYKKHDSDKTEIETLKEKSEHWEEKYRDAIADLSIENYWRMGNDSK